ncbi:hypothetical protein ACWCYL_26255 [Streptomyces sp. 900105755]
MAHFWINRDVSGAQEHQIHAESYTAKDEYIHFLDERQRVVMSIRKEITFLIERNDA